MKDDAEKNAPPAALASTRGETLAAPARTIGLASGRSIEIEETGREEHIKVRSADGNLVLSLRLTDEGPVLSLSAVSLEIAAQKHLALKSDTLAIQTSGDATLDVGGSLHERTRGSAIREVGKASIERAREVSIEAAPGGVVVKANDDVSITGERVRLNSDEPPMPLTWEEHHARQAKRLAAAAERTHEIGVPGLGPFRIPEP
ncbi:hypothetical protein [Polyangium sp. y55x31]|uniref:hypothetical protein n=1 Tax=Polyangium sp. y55x31 TaxID=3042688 RepID=UPI002482E6FD|nr:hypothetical protein [Polyangium sp. y55x31]MDI1484123.1 hypothetical protein [Polyangium sp. y55x31]